MTDVRSSDRASAERPEAAGVEPGQMYMHRAPDGISYLSLVLSGDQEHGELVWRVAAFQWVDGVGYCGAFDRPFYSSDFARSGLTLVGQIPPPAAPGAPADARLNETAQSAHPEPFGIETGNSDSYRSPLAGHETESESGAVQGPAIQDRERLDWLEAHPQVVKFGRGYRGSPDSWFYEFGPERGMLSSASLRVAIDAAMKEQP